MKTILHYFEYLNYVNDGSIFMNKAGWYTAKNNACGPDLF